MKFIIFILIFYCEISFSEEIHKFSKKNNLDRGLIEVSERFGFRISSEAECNFKIIRKKINQKINFEIPKSALVFSGLKINLFRYRNGFYKRIDFNVISKSKKALMVNSDDLITGDEIALTGLGFLRVVEISAFSEAPSEHSH